MACRGVHPSAPNFLGYSHFLSLDAPPELRKVSSREQRLFRMLVASLTTVRAAAPFEDAVAQIWANPQVRAELLDLLALLRERVSYVDWPLGIHAPARLDPGRAARQRWVRLRRLPGQGLRLQRGLRAARRVRLHRPRALPPPRGGRDQA